MFVRLHQRLLSNNASVLQHIPKKFATTVSAEHESTSDVVYPPILDMTFKAKIKRKREQWYEKIKNIQTVEEKLLEINMPRYYGWKSLILNEDRVPYNSLDHAQYITRTYVVPERGLPAFYDNVISAEELESIVNDIKGQIEDNIAFEYSSRRRKHELMEDQLENKRVMENVIANAVVQQINRTLQLNISTIRPHLLEAQIDFEPRVEAFWFAGGIDPPAMTMRTRQALPWLRKYVNDPADVRVQYFGKPVLHLRHDFPLKEIISLSESENPSLVVPQFKFDPRVLGYALKRKHGTNIPGFWPGDACEFGFLSYHNRGYLLTRPDTFNDNNDALITQAMFASYSWLLAQACYQGFSTFHDVTYPLVNQAIITNGQDWSFCVYQLNTTLLHSENADENPRRNMCWITEPMKLFEKVEGEKVYGLNTDVIKSLVKFYVNAPEKRSGVEMKPYLGKSVKVIADITDDAQRVWLEKHYKHLVANRPRHRRAPEMYHWQKIYVVDNKTRPMDKKRHPFEFGIHVMHRRLDDHAPQYIPRCLRANPKKRSVGKWEKTYYP